MRTGQSSKRAHVSRSELITSKSAASQDVRCRITAANRSYFIEVKQPNKCLSIATKAIKFDPRSQN